MSSTSYHRASAFERLGHSIHYFIPKIHFSSSGLLGHLHYKTGYRFIQNHMLSALRNLDINFEKFDLIWVNSGEWFGRKILDFLKSFDVPVVLYNNDDPTGNRDGNRFLTLRKAISKYDLCVVRVEKNIDDYRRLGVEALHKVYMSYDEVYHKQYENVSDIPSSFKSDIAFIGTWIRKEKRDIFLLKLIDSGLSVAIWGARWEKSPHFEKLKPYYRGGSIGGRDYVAAIQGSKICLGLLSKANSDLHTRRSVEIPYAGGILCAEKTPQHQLLYIDGEEAVFWQDADECAKLCIQLLNDNEKREAIRNAGYQRVINSGLGNEVMLKGVMDKLRELKLLR